MTMAMPTSTRPEMRPNRVARSIRGCPFGKITGLSEPFPNLPPGGQAAPAKDPDHGPSPPGRARGLAYTGKVGNYTTRNRRSGFLGSGLGESLDRLAGVRTLPVADIPGYPASTAPGHAGAFLHAELAGRPVLVQRGRVHLYEGYPARVVCLGVRAMALTGVRTLVLTNAAGALNPQFEAGGLMLLTDHINFSGQSPLTGPKPRALGAALPGHVPVSTTGSSRPWPWTRPGGCPSAWSAGSTSRCRDPPWRPRPETRAFRRLGADAIGMSTVLEAHRRPAHGGEGPGAFLPDQQEPAPTAWRRPPRRSSWRRPNARPGISCAWSRDCWPACDRKERGSSP